MKVLKPSEILTHSKVQFGNSTLSQNRRVFKWATEIKGGREGVENVINHDRRPRIRLIDDNIRTVREHISPEVGISYGTVRWVPSLLTGN